MLFIHDAAIDDFIATMLLVAMPNVDLKGIVIADADCIPQPGIDAANRLQQFIGRPEDFGRKKIDDYTANDYHKVSDEIKADWDLAVASQPLLPIPPLD